MKAKPWNDDWQIVEVGASFNVMHKGVKVGAAWTREIAEQIVDAKRERCPICGGIKCSRSKIVRFARGNSQSFYCVTRPMYVVCDITEDETP